MEWQIIKLNEDEMVLGSNTKGPYWVRSYDLDGTEMSGAFFEELVKYQRQKKEQRAEAEERLYA